MMRVMSLSEGQSSNGSNDSNDYSAGRLPEEVFELAYFHTQFKSTEDVRRYIQKYNCQPGDFLLRPSFSSPDRLTISVVVSRGDVRHMNIFFNQSGFFLIADKPFDSLADLIKYYARTDISNEEKVTNVRFQRSICRERRRTSDPASRSPASHGSNHMLNVSRMNERQLPHASAFKGPATRSHNKGYKPTLAPIQCPNSSSSDSSAKVGRTQSMPTTTPAQRATVNSSVNHGNIAQRWHPSNVKERPLPPLPIDSREIEGDLAPKYSTVSPNDIDQSKNLIAILSTTEKPGYCVCGLKIDQTDLPEGWSIHLNRVASTRGCLFFQSSENVTSWRLPESIIKSLTCDQREYMTVLLQMYDCQLQL